jgi:5-methylcytosine-specific restriction enzyme A
MVRPLRPCTEPGCATLVKRGRCSDHLVERPKNPDQQRFYGSTRWKALRTLVKKQEPICRMCRRKPTKVADHIDGDWRNNARENLRGLCTDCNAEHTARQHQAKRAPRGR